MNQRYKNILMWSLYALLFLFVMLLQTTVFGRQRFFGVKLSLIPVVLICVSVVTGHEEGGLYGLICAFIWHLSGAEDGSVAILTMTVCSIAAGYICITFSHRFLPALLLCFGALLVHEGVVFAFRFYLGAAEGKLILWALITAALSLPACPICYLLAKAIRKVGE